jgi:hypothetical protein
VCPYLLTHYGLTIYIKFLKKVLLYLKKAKERRIYGNSNTIFSMQKYTKSSKKILRKKETPKSFKILLLLLLL